MMKEKKDHILEELREIAPGLEDLKRDSPYKVPHNYFKQLPEQVFERIREEQAQPSLWQRIDIQIGMFLESLRKPQYAMALASVVIIVVAGVFLMRPADDGAFLTGITQEDAYAYVLANIDAYEAHEIYALQPDAELNIGGLNALTTEELDQAVDELLEGLDPESLEELF